MKLSSTGMSPLITVLALALAAVSGQADAYRVVYRPDHLAAPPPHDLSGLSVTAGRSVAPYEYSNSASRMWFGRSGGGAKLAKTAAEQETDKKKADCDEPAGNETSGNPVVLSTGNKVESELDFSSEGEMGLYLERIYNHYWNSTGVFGRYWLSNFDYSLRLDSQNVIWAQRPDGRRIKFLYDQSKGRWSENRAAPLAYIVRNSDGTYTLHNETRGTERYSPEGYITELRSESGIAWYFTYTGLYLQKVQHSSGRAIQFLWNGNQMTQVTAPNGAVYRYAYTTETLGSGRPRLIRATLPGSPETVVNYHYEDSRFPGALTGKSFNSERYSTFAYDSEGRAVSTEHAGGVERYTFSYEVEAAESLPLPPSTPLPGGFQDEEERTGCISRSGMRGVCERVAAIGSSPFGAMSLLATTASVGTTQSRPTRLLVREINPLGKETVYLYVDGRKTSVTGSPSLNCPASSKELRYDANGNEDMVSDFENVQTDFDYDAHGHLLKKVEAAGTPVARTTTYGWDENRNRLTRKTITGDSETSYSYLDNGRLASSTVVNLSGKGVPGQSRTTRFTHTYHGNGMLASTAVDGPLSSDTVVYAYNSSGDLLENLTALLRLNQGATE